MISPELKAKYYSDEKYNGTKSFYNWIRTHLNPSSVVLNLGAGPATRSQLRSLCGEVQEVIGADIDPIVLENDECDRAILIKDGTIPLGDQTFDLIYSDFVLEHVEDPEKFLSEVYRLLKDGGSYMFRTPNLYHYVSLISWGTPHWFHELVANRVRGLPDEAHEPWPTFYRMNSARTLRRQASHAGFTEVQLELREFEPSYLCFSRISFYAGLAYERFVNSTPLLQNLRVNILGRMVKRAALSPRSH